jgi:hypothetical protein
MELDARYTVVLSHFLKQKSQEVLHMTLLHNTSFLNDTLMANASAGLFCHYVV